MQRAHKIRLVPNKTQLGALKKAAGTARYVYNWALAAWKQQYEDFKEGKTEEKPGPYSLARKWTKERPEWSKEVATTLQTQAILNVGSAYTSMWKMHTAYPKFKKKSDRQSFYMGNSRTYTSKLKVHLPMIGKVKLREELRFKGKPMSYTISCEAGHWYVSVQVELDKPPKPTKSKSVIGVDVGIKNLAVASDGTALVNPKNLSKQQKRLKRWQRKLARQQKGSNRRNATKLRIAKIHARIVNQRNDSIHKFTTSLAKNHGTAVIETLDIQGMVANAPKWVRGSFQDTAMREVHRQLGYKMREVIKAPRCYPSSKTCSSCGDVKESLPPEIRVYKCSCGAVLDRDLNAAYNLRDMGWVTTPICAEPLKGAMKRKAKTTTAR
jgi:putative transposase